MSVLNSCAPQQVSSTLEAQAASHPDGAKFSFEIPPEPIDDSQINHTVETEIVVVGAGIAGVVAALSAAEEGSRVVLIEKNTGLRVGGGDNAAIGSRLQKEMGIEFDKNEIITRFMKSYNTIPDQRLMRMWADHSGEIMDWMIDLAEPAGVTVTIPSYPYPDGFDIDGEYSGFYATNHNFNDDSGVWSEKPIMSVIRDNALDKGVEFYYQTPAVQLIQDEDNRVTGLIARDNDGKTIKFSAGKAVILCTGDYGNNPEMMQKYHLPDVAEIAGTSNIYTALMEEQPAIPLNTGDGHLMCLWAGGMMENSPRGSISTYAFLPFYGSFLHVNGQGIRYENEDTDPGEWINSIIQQPGKIAYQVFDAKYEEDYEKMYTWTREGHVLISDEIKEQVESQALKADTIEELAGLMEVPVETFKNTVARRNELAKKGEDIDFGLAPHRLSSITKAPFYAIKISTVFVVTLDGIKVDQRLQPLTPDGESIQGLYVAGNVVGQRFGTYYYHLTPGLTNAMAWTHGYLAGKYASV